MFPPKKRTSTAAYAFICCPKAAALATASCIVPPLSWQTVEASAVDSVSSKNEFKLEDSINNVNRNEKNIVRDKYRNPLKTLTFFEIQRNKKILEISPGNGYYSEIISHYMRNTNNYFVTEYKYPPVEAVKKGQEKFKTYFKNNQKKFGEINTIYFQEGNILETKNKNFDLVLTFRNTHNWLGSDTAFNVYKSIYDSMKKGGILGIVQHRGDEKMNKNFYNGYVKESFLINFIEKIGFKFLEKSNINQNTKDTKDYKNGVWTLPPRLVLGEKNKNKYLKIGESDRMTLKFIK